MERELTNIAQSTLDLALQQGAQQAAVRVSRARFVELKRREGRVESLQASTSRGLSLSLYADGRYSSNSTSLLQAGALAEFVDRALAMTRTLSPDPHRALPEPELYGPTPGAKLDLSDPGFDDLDTDQRLALAAAAEQAALEGGDAIISVTAGASTRAGESLQIHSNGFRGETSGTSFYLGAAVTVKDDDGRRPEDYWYTGARHLEDLPDAASIGREAARRALDRRGSGKVESRRMTLVLENRAASRMVSSLLEPLYGALLQQRRSCFEGKLGQVVAASGLTLVDQPLLPRGLGSRTYDGEGLAARPLPLITGGRLDNYLVDVYYGRKLGRPPTTGGPSNLVLQPGDRSLQQLISGVDRGILVTGFLGGNANPATGDFSFGITGRQLRGGKPGRPVSEMNINGNHQRLWQRLAAAGDDPYPYSAWRIPSLVLEDVQFSGI